MDDIVMAEAVGRFNIFTGILKAGGGDGEPMTLAGVASSSVEDLHGDRIERSALKDMERQVANGLTIFLNHSYRVPEDVAGYASSARVTKRGEDADGNAVWDLDMEITVNDENPRATEAWRGIRKKGAKVGLSIGANIPPGGYEVDPKTGGKTIKRINLLETSIVGIPANPRSWISMALKSIEAPAPKGKGVYLGFGGLTTNGTDSATWTLVSPEEVAAAPPADDRDELDVEAACSSCGKGRDADGCDDAYHDMKGSDAPGTQADDAAPGALGDPGPEATSGIEPLEGDTEVAAVIGSLERISGEVTATHLRMAVDIARALAEQVVVLRSERDAALRAKDEAERERDKVIRGTDLILAQTAQVIKTVGDMPLGRKTVLRQEASKVRHLEGVFGAEFMQMLEK